MTPSSLAHFPHFFYLWGFEECILRTFRIPNTKTQSFMFAVTRQWKIAGKRILLISCLSVGQALKILKMKKKSWKSEENEEGSITISCKGKSNVVNKFVFFFNLQRLINIQHCDKSPCENINSIDVQKWGNKSYQHRWKQFFLHTP